jgi:hypothetical protein
VDSSGTGGSQLEFTPSRPARGLGSRVVACYPRSTPTVGSGGRHTSSGRNGDSGTHPVAQPGRGVTHSRRLESLPPRRRRGQPDPGLMRAAPAPAQRRLGNPPVAQLADDPPSAARNGPPS